MISLPEPLGLAGVALQRARGTVRLGLVRRDEDTALSLLYQQGCLKIRLPRAVDAGWREAICLNNSGGVAGGDALSTSLHVGQGAAGVLTSASAERIYRCGAGEAPASIRNNVVLEAGARGEWLPQETILFEGSAMDRRLEVSLAGSARLLACETLVFGRLAMGETVRAARLRDVISIRREGRLILHEALRPPQPVASALARMAVGGGARASTTLVWVAPEAAGALGPVRDVLAAHPGVQAGASAWDGMLVVRMLAGDPALLRPAIAELLPLLRGGRMLPRVWGC